MTVVISDTIILTDVTAILENTLSRPPPNHQGHYHTSNVEPGPQDAD